MIEKCKALYKKYEELILYVFFGGCTTVVSISTYWLFTYPFGMSNIQGTVFSNVLAILFAYVTNSIWVFHSEIDVTQWKPVLKEMTSFLSSRLSTFLLELGLMWLLVDKLGFNGMLMKVIVTVIVIILNYVLSKLVVFKKKTK